MAAHLGLERLDTGAMYRAVAWPALSAGLDATDREAVAELARGLTIEVGDRVTVDGARRHRRHPHGRRGRRRLGRGGQPGGACRPGGPPTSPGWPNAVPGVVEGRDIGTVVLPDADLKIYLTAADREPGPAPGPRNGPTAAA